MKFSTIKKFLPVVPTGLLLAVFFLDLLAFVSRAVVETILNVRELLLAVAFLLLLPGFKKSKWVVDKNIANKLKGLFICVMGVYLSFFIPNLFFFPKLNLDQESFHPVFSSLNTLLYATISSILVTIFGIFILLLLRDLIYAKRKRTTHRSFRLAIYVMIIQLVYF
ncbi:MAG: hypothetical protein ONB05_06075, partial [candidate division KSB1 bacterium]|nr:hypothetical protein [candidate division KSB1 bacterium]